MCCSNILILLLCVGLANVKSMVIEGPVLTIYNPCGLGAILFERTGDQYWKGIIHFGLYSSQMEVETEIHFENPVNIFKFNDSNTFAARRTSWTNLIVRHSTPIPSTNDFQVKVVGGSKMDVPVVSKFILNNATLCSNEIKASHRIAHSSLNFNNNDNRYAQVCGRKSLRHTELVSVRTEAKAGDWPWHVAMMIQDVKTNVSKYDCGGNIISRTAVLTAGHCIFKNGMLLETDRVAVIAGTNNYKDLYQTGKQVLLAKELVLHPAYNYEYSTSDLGIIKVDSFYFTEFVQPICVWGPSYDKTMLFEKEATVVGFGFTENDNPSEVLRSTNLKIQKDSTCIQFLQNVYKKLMNEFTFCAGYGPTSSVNPRNGDSGGGLVFRTYQPDNRISWYLRGVLSKCGVSSDQGNCDPTYYVVYTDVAPHYGWIAHHSYSQ